jgi:predicted nucleic acid-binding protein
LAKRYLAEPGSDEFDRFLGRRSAVTISRLTVVELYCLLNRRRRNREIDDAAQRTITAAFEEDVARGFFEVHALEDRHALTARDLLMRLNTVPLRTLDALHLAIAIAIDTDAIATADDNLAAAAAILRLKVEWFGPSAPRKRR